MIQRLIRSIQVALGLRRRKYRSATVIQLRPYQRFGN